MNYTKKLRFLNGGKNYYVNAIVKQPKLTEVNLQTIEASGPEELNIDINRYKTIIYVVFVRLCFRT